MGASLRKSEFRVAARADGPAARARPARLTATARMPPQPGRFLETRFLKPLRISQSELAVALGVSRRRINELIRGHRAITADTAVRLGTYFGNEPAFWLQLQLAWDVYVATRRAASRPDAKAR
ncbi:MAG: HigA family addiction module antitoxin [Burkholderiales bacterium]|jgi:addiction module HigA family antidote|nr:HigA family addiction module antitoxin [Burkholderiales bacterium]